MNETSAIQNLLVAQLSEAEPECPDLCTEKTVTFGSSTVISTHLMHDTHKAVLREILQRSTWPLADFVAVCAKADLMPWAFVRTLNDWAVEAYGDLLLEDGDKILTVNQNLKRKIHV